MTPPSTGLDLFRKVVTDVRSLTAIGVKGAVAVPLADYLLHLGPPWPPHVPVITSIVELVVLVLVFHFWFRTSARKLNRRMKVLLAVSVLSLAGYLYLLSEYTSPHPVNGQRIVHGFTVLPDMKSVIGDTIPLPRALEEAEYDPFAVWTSSSITEVRLLMLVAWIGFFGSLVMFLGVFVIQQRLRPAAERGSRRGRRRPSRPPPVAGEGAGDAG